MNSLLKKLSMTAMSIALLSPSVYASSSFSISDNAVNTGYVTGYTDGTFKPSNNITKNEALIMVGRLLDVEQSSTETINIQVLHADKDEPSMSAEFFVKEGVELIKNDAGYQVNFNIANEGWGFTDVINSMEHKVNGNYTNLTLTKSADKTTATFSIQIPNLTDEVVLRAGIAPMGDAKPDLRIKFETSTLKTGEAQSKDDALADVWSELGLSATSTAITREEFAEILAKVAKLNTNVTSSPFSDVTTSNSNFKYIVAAANAGYITGYEDGTFAPKNTVTRAEAVTMINRMIGDTTSVNSTTSQFSDVPTTHWAFEQVMRAIN
ncbi:MAG: hypothetical protein ATN36_05980 [Epulopiscium sp. Nele67-Bin005]|nr:MAG: hypothetical protein ATN36_05980 [Epulopiscium sp. Nele67-Bin005]